MQREWAVKWIVAAIIAAIVVSFVLFLLDAKDKTKLSLAGKVFTAKIADDDEEQARGLGGTENLPENQALLMIYNTSGKWAVWMKDMQYNLDIVWLDEHKRVVDTARNIAPSTFPNKFSPRMNAKYIIEFSAGTIERYRIEPGNIIGFQEGVW